MLYFTTLLCYKTYDYEIISHRRGLYKYFRFAVRVLRFNRLITSERERKRGGGKREKRQVVYKIFHKPLVISKQSGMGHAVLVNALDVFYRTIIWVILSVSCVTPARHGVRLYDDQERVDSGRGCGVLLPQYEGRQRAVRGLPRIFYGTFGQIPHVL